MYCLWNGKYGEHDLSFAPALKTTLRIQAEQYPQYVGCVVGDFTCEKVEYDWGRRDQRWTCRCNLCGRVIYQYHTKDWRRGKGRTILCECRKEQIEREKREKAAQKKAERLAEKQTAIGNVLGKEYNGWTVIEYNGGVGCTIRCAECGKERRISKKQDFDMLIKRETAKCDHQKPMDFTGDEWIGQRSGHLTVIGRQGKFFVAKCDCGSIEVVKPTFMFVYKSKQTCSSDNCQYRSNRQIESQVKKQNGYDFERFVTEELKSMGYKAQKTQNMSDYGVDVIVRGVRGEKIAVQCKKQSANAGVKAVQEVYAGGAFYDCDKCVVVCNSGFSKNAQKMANKLGVYLCDEDFYTVDNKAVF